MEFTQKADSLHNEKMIIIITVLCLAACEHFAQTLIAFITPKIGAQSCEII